MATSEPQNPSGELDPQRRIAILEAALQCFTRFGITRTSIQDVAAAAKVSRTTVYRYFEDRNDLVQGAVDLATDQFYVLAAQQMETAESLVAQIGEVARVICHTIETRRIHATADDEETMRHLLTGSLVRRMSEFLQPYLEAAKARGEVRRDLDTHAASEFLARLLQSLFTAEQSAVFDLAKPRTVVTFLEQFAIAGLD